MPIIRDPLCSIMRPVLRQVLTGSGGAAIAPAFQAAGTGAASAGAITPIWPAH